MNKVVFPPVYFTSSVSPKKLECSLENCWLGQNVPQKWNPRSDTANLEKFNWIFFSNADDGLPEPPSFLHDIVYPTDSNRDPRYDSDGAMPYHPPSPGRQRQVTLQIC